MSFCRARIVCACCLALACVSERAPAPTGEAPSQLRSEPGRFSLPSDPKALASALAVPAESLRAAGEERYGRQEYDSARAIWRVELTRADVSGDGTAEARVRMWLGLAAWRLGDFESARSEGERSLSMKRKLHMESEMARSFNALGLLAWHEARLRDALQHFDSAKASATRNHDATGVARALSNIPLVYLDLGNFDAARRGFVAALAAAKGLDDDLIQGNALANLGMLESRLGNAHGAIDLLDQARSHYQRIEYRTGESNALGQLAIAWSQLGDLQRAIAAADSALAIARADGLQQEVAAEIEAIADLQLEAGSPRVALRLLAEADSIDAVVGLNMERGTNLRRVAAILTELGEYPAAIARARQAVAAHRRAEARVEEVYDRLQLAQSLSLDHQEIEARAQTDSATLDARRTGNPSAVRTAVGVSAQLALDSNDPLHALRELEGMRRGEAPENWRIADLRAEALFRLGRLDGARREGERAISALERERGSLGMGPLRSMYLANRSAPFSHLVAIHLARHDTAAAFAVAASVPGRDLSERFGGLFDAPHSLRVVAEGERLLLRAATLEDTLSHLQRDPKTAEKARALERELAAVRSAYEEHLIDRAAEPEAPMLGFASVTLKGVQSRLQEDEAVLAFLSGRDRLDVFVVRRNLVLQASIPIGTRALGRRVRLARELLAGPRRVPDSNSVLGDLYDLLIGPAERGQSLAGVTHVIVIP
ncbi:MAG: hypothetical protein QOK07_2835, partial [Gemmatimonadaceae bacterium]|nr:hypothetical protein [Gemmatimonadaceae bacterium]